MVQKWKPFPQPVERYTSIVEHLQQRQLLTKAQDKQTDERALHQDSVCVVVGEETIKSTRTRKEMNMQWTRAEVSVGLPMSFFDNKEVLKTVPAVLFTTECGSKYREQPAPQ